MNARLYPSFLVAAVLTVGLLVVARAEESTSTIKFSDPAKPGTVKIVLARGDIRIVGSDTAEVVVKSEAKPTSDKPRKDGLRVLTASSSFSLSEKDNVVTLDASSDGWIGGGSDFRLTVPRNTAIVVKSSFGGDITCSGVAGDIELHSMNGEVRLDDIAGGVVVDTMNGEISATIRELHATKPLSFTSMNGEVVLRLPADAKASVRLRTQNGAVLTDFPENALVTKTESAPRGSLSRRGRTISFNGRTVLAPEAAEAIREAARVGVAAAHEAVQALHEGVEAARAQAEGERERAEAMRERAEARAGRLSTGTAAPVAPLPPMPPMPPAIPTISGGKLVTGTLNGGGPEISVSTMNGDVTLRQLDKK